MKELFINLYNYFKETYFSPDLSAIENFDTYETERFMPFLVVGICLGVFIAYCIGYYNHQYLGSVVRKLYSAGAFDENSAKTLDEIGCNKYFIKKNLCKESVLAKYVVSQTAPKTAKEAENAKFYIPEADKYVADKRFKKVKGGKLSLLITFIICVCGCFALLSILPQILQLADNVITMTKPK